MHRRLTSPIRFGATPVGLAELSDALACLGVAYRSALTFHSDIAVR